MWKGSSRGGRERKSRKGAEGRSVECWMDEVGERERAELGEAFERTGRPPTCWRRVPRLVAGEVELHQHDVMLTASEFLTSSV